MGNATSTSNPESARGAHEQDRAPDEIENPADLESMFPADPELMVSPEGDRAGLAKVRERAQQRRDELAGQS
jgi:hypothetical protein